MNLGVVAVERIGAPTGLGFCVFETEGDCAGSIGASLCAGVCFGGVAWFVVFCLVVVCGALWLAVVCDILP